MGKKNRICSITILLVIISFFQCDMHLSGLKVAQIWNAYWCRQIAQQKMPLISVRGAEKGTSNIQKDWEKFSRFLSLSFFSILPGNFTCGKGSLLVRSTVLAREQVSSFQFEKLLSSEDGVNLYCSLCPHCLVSEVGHLQKMCDRAG